MSQFDMVFEVLTLILSINRHFLISSHATSSLHDICKSYFIEMSNTYIIVEFLCVVYFNSLSIFSKKYFVHENEKCYCSPGGMVNGLELCYQQVSTVAEKPAASDQFGQN